MVEIFAEGASQLADRSEEQVLDRSLAAPDDLGDLGELETRVVAEHRAAGWVAPAPGELP